MDKSGASRVVIVDDMVINRMIIASLLSSNGVASDQAESGRECLELVEKNDYDLILLDHRMPDFDGVDTLMALKDIFQKKGREIPVICHTTEEGRKNINLYKAAGFADVLIKPIDPKQLAEVLMTYLPEEKEIVEEEIEDEEPMIGEYPEDADELDKLPLWLKRVPHIDLVKGIENCGSAEDYLDALYVFYSSIEEKRDDIVNFKGNKEWTMYKLSVHSLKSIARLVGARDVAALAKKLEDAAGEMDIETINEYTKELLEAYTKFSDYLEPLLEDDIIKELIRASNEAEQEKKEPERIYDKSHTVLYIRPKHGIVIKGVEKSLKEADYQIISVGDEPDEIISYRDRADIVLYHPVSGDESHIMITMNLLSEICTDDSKILLLIGDKADIEIARRANGYNLVTEVYTRPVKMEKFIEDIKGYSMLLEEYSRRKTIFLVDDDPDYTAIVSKWLSKSYDIAAFNEGEELIKGLGASKPDLILMDYEMPNLDGYDLMKRIRLDEDMKSIPVIFLTGKNDKEHVFKILNYKPDGYLLKSSQKENLLDSIERFFKETMYRRALDKDFEGM